MRLPFGWEVWKSLWFLQLSWFVGSLLHEFILLIIIVLLWLQVTGMRRRGMVRSFANKPWQGHSFTVSLLKSLHFSSIGFHGWDWDLSHRWVGFAWVLVPKDVFRFGVWQWGFRWLSGLSLNVMECNLNDGFSREEKLGAFDRLYV